MRDHEARWRIESKDRENSWDRKRSGNASRNGWQDGEHTPSSSRLEQDPFVAIRQSLPPFLSDITVPTSESFTQPSPQRHEKKETPLLFTSSPSPHPLPLQRKNYFESQQMALSDNIWSRQENRHGYTAPVSSYSSVGNGNTHRNGHRLSSTVPFGQRPHPFIKDDDSAQRDSEQSDDMRDPREDDDCSSNEFVYNRHSSPDWISVKRSKRRNGLI
jgi:hypothetical protein